MQIRNMNIVKLPDAIFIRDLVERFRQESEVHLWTNFHQPLFFYTSFL